MDLRREKLEGDLGEEGLEKWEVLQWSLGLLGSEEVGVQVVRQRRLGLETG